MLKRKSKSCVVKLTPSAYEQLQKLAEKIAREGWQSVGARRDDLPTLGAVIAEAIMRLEAAS